MRLSMALICVIASIPAVAQEMYTCTIDGRKIIQDRPCKGAPIKMKSADYKPAEPVATEQQAAPPVAATVDYAKQDRERRDAYLAASEKSRKIRDLEHRIKITEREIESLQEERDKKLSFLRREKGYANNNLAGAVYLESLSGEMQAITTRYETDIRGKQADLKKLQDELNSAKKS